MILQVYAMWHDSLCPPVHLCVPQVIVSLVFLGIYYNPTTYLSGMFQVKL